MHNSYKALTHRFLVFCGKYWNKEIWWALQTVHTGWAHNKCTQIPELCEWLLFQPEKQQPLQHCSEHCIYNSGPSPVLWQAQFSNCVCRGLDTLFLPWMFFTEAPLQHQKFQSLVVAVAFFWMFPSFWWWYLGIYAKKMIIYIKVLGLFWRVYFPSSCSRFSCFSRECMPDKVGISAYL